MKNLLFQEVKIRNTAIRNRTVMLSMATNLADSNGGASQTMIDYYAARAQGGAGLIIVENSGIDPTGRNGAIQLRCDKLDYVPGLGRIADAIHYYGAKTVIQLQHAGLSTKEEYIGETPLGPSERKSPEGKVLCRAMTVAEIEAMVQKYAASAKFAEMAGFDGVEIHAAHSYLLADFITPLANFRTDEYGGSLENRARFLIEVIRAVRACVNPNFIISVRINGLEVEDGGIIPEEAAKVAVMAETAGADLLNVSSGFIRHSENLTNYTPAGWRVYVAKIIREKVGIPVICSGGLRTRREMEEALSSGSADLIGVGRQFIADPGWVNKMAVNEDSICACITCNLGCVGNRILGKRSIQCSVNPDIAREGAAFFTSHPCIKSKRIAIIGAGPAGIIAASESARRGHVVQVWEKRSDVSGSLAEATSVAGKEGMKRYVGYLKYLANCGDFIVKTSCEANEQEIEAFRPDIIIYAGGLVPNTLAKILDYSSGNVMTAHRFLLEDQGTLTGRSVAVIGGGSVGCEVAERLAQQQNQVSVIEMTDQLGTGTPELNKRELLARMKKLGIHVMMETRLLGMEDGLLCLEHEGKQQKMSADNIIVAAGGHNEQPEWLTRYCQKGVSLYTIGDGAALGNIMSAVQQATALSRSL